MPINKAFGVVKSFCPLFTHSSPLFTGMWLGACRLFLFYIAKVIKIFNIIVVLNKNYFFSIWKSKWGCSKGRLVMEKTFCLYFPEKGCHLGTNRSDNET